MSFDPSYSETLLPGVGFPGMFDAYRNRQSSYVEKLLPVDAVQLSVYELLETLSQRYGFDQIQRVLKGDADIQSPVSRETNGNWLKTTRMVGINVRTVGNFLNVVKYALTLPSFHRCLHLLPIWEPGVVGSLYGIASWRINPEFFSQELYTLFPQLNTVDKQLKVCMDLLHLMGFTIGMDVIPHTDRFSEIVLAYPDYFEWVCQKKGNMLDHSETLSQQVSERIYEFLIQHGTADASALPDFEHLFGKERSELPEERRFGVLFGEPLDYHSRQQRRIRIMRYLLEEGFETLPMTMAPPYRGLHINPDVFIQDEHGYTWYQYEFDNPQPMSRVFGPLTRYRLFHARDNNLHWELDFDRPIPEVWQYVARKYADFQHDFGFDFMRGDMTHVQMRPEGVPARLPEFYDILGNVKSYIQRQGAVYFAFFAESFVGVPDFMGYGDEVAHLEAMGADVTLGDLQSTVVGSELFVARLRQYMDLAATRRCKPSFTLLTADKDDPRFDEYYRTGNLIRYFIALFMTDLPSYVAAGFEVRNPHHQRGANEEYSKLYVFQIRDENETDKVTHGPYEWGHNLAQFEKIVEMRNLAEQILPSFAEEPLKWLAYPDPTLSVSYCAWQVSRYIFVCNLSSQQVAGHVTLPQVSQEQGLRRIYSLEEQKEELPVGNGLFYSLAPLLPGECRIYIVTPGA